MNDDEVRVRACLPSNLTLRRREDGFYDLFDQDGSQAALMDWCVEADQRNDRGGEIGQAYPLTLGEILGVIEP